MAAGRKIRPLESLGRLSELKACPRYMLHKIMLNNGSVARLTCAQVCERRIALDWMETNT